MPLHTPATVRARVEDVRRLRRMLDRLPSGRDPSRDELAADVDDWLEDVSGLFDSMWSSLWGSTVDAADVWSAKLVAFLRQRGVDAEPTFKPNSTELPITWVVALVVVAVVAVAASLRGRR